VICSQGDFFVQIQFFKYKDWNSKNNELQRRHITMSRVDFGAKPTFCTDQLAKEVYIAYNEIS